MRVGSAITVAPAPAKQRRRAEHVVDLERDPDVTGDAPSDLDRVDVRGVRGIGELERGATCVENRHATAVVRGERALDGEPEDVVVEAQRLVVVRSRDAEPQLADAHTAGPAAAISSPASANFDSKLSRNIAASSDAFASYAAGSAHVARGSSSPSSIPGT